MLAFIEETSVSPGGFAPVIWWQKTLGMSNFDPHSEPTPVVPLAEEKSKLSQLKNNVPQLED